MGEGREDLNGGDPAFGIVRTSQLSSQVYSFNLCYGADGGPSNERLDVGAWRMAVGVGRGCRPGGCISVVRMGGGTLC